MSNRHKHIANANWEEAGCMTSRHANKSGLSKGLARAKKYYNRIGKRADEKFALISQDV
jgi:nuclear transport factor 2 (NTF2) superfamily protein